MHLSVFHFDHPPQCVMDPETAEPLDELSLQAKQFLEMIGCTATTVSEIVRSRDDKVYAAIQEGIDRANTLSISNAQKVCISTV